MARELAFAMGIYNRHLQSAFTIGIGIAIIANPMPSRLSPRWPLCAEHVLLLAYVIQKELKATPDLTSKHLPLYVLFISWVQHKEATVVRQRIMVYIKILCALVTTLRTIGIVLSTPLAVTPTSNHLLSPILQANDTINLGNNTIGSASHAFLNWSASTTALTLSPAMAYKSVTKSSTMTFQEPISALMSTTTPSSSLTKSLWSRLSRLPWKIWLLMWLFIRTTLYSQIRTRPQEYQVGTALLQ